MDTTPDILTTDEATNGRVRLLVRAILVLAFTGLFVAGSLSVGKLFGLGLPCGAAHGCDVVNSHPTSKFFGIPVAYIGFLGYALIAGLAFGRSGLSAAAAKRVSLLGYVVSAVGALASVVLQIVSLTVIHAVCLWCLASAAIMIVLLVLHALEYGDRVSDAVPDGRSEFKLATALTAVVALALVGFKVNLQKSSYRAPIEISDDAIGKNPLVPAGAHIYGDKESPVTIVEFADLMCPTCQQASPKVKEFVATHPGKVRLVYRSFPLTVHPMGTLAAGVAEVASDEGKFWEFAAATMATGENMQTPDRVFEVARSVGLDSDKIKAKLSDETGPATQRLTRDVNAANALGINVTPTFIVQVKGQPTEAYTYATMMDELRTGRYKKYIDGP